MKQTLILKCKSAKAAAKLSQVSSEDEFSDDGSDGWTTDDDSPTSAALPATLTLSPASHNCIVPVSNVTKPSIGATTVPTTTQQDVSSARKLRIEENMLLLTTIQTLIALELEISRASTDSREISDRQTARILALQSSTQEMMDDLHHKLSATAAVVSIPDTSVEVNLHTTCVNNGGHNWHPPLKSINPSV